MPEMKTVKSDEVARVEGEGGITIRLEDGRATEVKLRIFEPPRFFEGFLRGRPASDAPDLTARVCGICPVAYQMSASRAIEDALGIAVEPGVRTLRRLLYSGEWIESHVLHMFLLHLPDFFGCDDVVGLTKLRPDLVERALRAKKVGNALVAAVGGREIHPVNVRLGGFHRVPGRLELRALLPELDRASVLMRETIDWLATLEFPSLERDFERVALRHPTEYAILDGRIVSSAGIDIAEKEYEATFVERQDEHATALRSIVKGRGAYLTGPIARFDLNFDRLGAPAREAAKKVGLAPPVKNPFRGILVRAVETLQVIDDAVRLIDAYVPPDRPFTPVPHGLLRPGAVGCAATEAPRGILYHRYTLEANGTIRDCRIVPPTAQNQLSIEEDLRALGPQLAAAAPADATRLAEFAVRNHDPCISCATHLMKVKIERG